MNAQPATSASSRGVFITLEGGEGSGKSTQSRLLCSALAARGVAVVQTREPGGSPEAEAIRTLLIEGATDRWDPMSEALLLFAARRDHLRRTIEPALGAGSWVVCDRFGDSTVAYQGYAHGLGADTIAALAKIAIGQVKPDLTFILDLPVDVGLARAKEREAGREDRFERMGDAFHQRLRQGFREIAAQEPERCKVIDATQPIAAIHAAILGEIDARWPRAAFA
jgi:dTMP kinase